MKGKNPSPTYAKVVRAVKSKRLKEPFVPHDLVAACKMSSQTASKYPAKYRKGNPTGAPAYFIRNKDGRYKLTRPFKYGL